MPLAVSILVIDMMWNAWIMPRAFIVDKYKVDESFPLVAEFSVYFVPILIAMLVYVWLFAAYNKHNTFQWLQSIDGLYVVKFNLLSFAYITGGGVVVVVICDGAAQAVPIVGVGVGVGMVVVDAVNGLFVAIACDDSVAITGCDLN